MDRPLRRVGHKGADAIAPGNTLESFHAAVEANVDMIELDVLRPRGDFAAAGDWRRAQAGPAKGSGPLLVAHDWGDAARREPMTLEEVLDAFTRPPFDTVEIDCDLKIAGREDEVATALRERGLVPRSMISTMEVSSIRAMRDAEPDLRRGWTYPRTTRPWDRKRWARPAMLAALVAMRRRLPSLVRRGAPRLGASAMWVYHPLVTRRLAVACDVAGVELIAWTVDDAPRMRALRDLGVSGICTNDPRLFDGL
jgi:glycerophosphoryl diester phosphodiesterase